MPPWNSADEARATLRAALTQAMRDRDRPATRALREALGAIDNAEAADISAAPAVQGGTIAGGVRGLGAGEVERREVDVATIRSLLESAIDEKRLSADQYTRLGRSDEAADMMAEAAVLQALLTR